MWQTKFHKPQTCQMVYHFLRLTEHIHMTQICIAGRMKQGLLYGQGGGSTDGDG